MMKKSPLQVLGLLFVLAIFAAAVWWLGRELRANHVTFQKHSQ